MYVSHIYNDSNYLFYDGWNLAYYGMVLILEPCDQMPFIHHPDQASPGATESTGIASFDDCKTTCRENPDCFGFEWSSSRIECWIHTDHVNLITRFPNAGVHQYEVHPECRLRPPGTNTLIKHK